MIWILMAATAWIGLTVLFFSLCRAASRADEACDLAEAQMAAPPQATQVPKSASRALGPVLAVLPH